MPKHQNFDTWLYPHLKQMRSPSFTQAHCEIIPLHKRKNTWRHISLFLGVVEPAPNWGYMFRQQFLRNHLLQTTRVPAPPTRTVQIKPSRMLVVADTSGSVSAEDFQGFLNEMATMTLTPRRG